MGFKAFYEKFVTGDDFKPGYDDKEYFELFVNPSKSELLGVVRGVILPNGDFYTIKAFNNASDYLHEDLMDFLIKQKVLKGRMHRKGDMFNEGLDNYLAVVLYGRKWYPSDSYNWEPDLDDIAQKYFDKSQKKNPSIKFSTGQP